MACRLTLRAAPLVRSLRYHTYQVASQNGLQQSTSRVGLLCRSPMLTVNYAAPMSALFHTGQTKMNEFILNIQDEEDFKERVVKSSKPVIIDFFASWCGPCKLLVPRLEALGAVKNGSALLAKIDIDEMPDLAVNYGVEAVPTVIAMKNGKVIDKFVGLKDDVALASFVSKLVG